MLSRSNLIIATRLPSSSILLKTFSSLSSTPPPPGSSTRPIVKNKDTKVKITKTVSTGITGFIKQTIEKAKDLSFIAKQTEDKLIAADVSLQASLGVSLDNSTNKDGTILKNECGPLPDPNAPEDEDMEEMWCDTSTLYAGSKEWGGPTRGGRLAEPTRHGDWSRKGRCTDF